MPALQGETLVSLPWVPMNLVQSVLPLSSALVVVAEMTHLVDLLVAPSTAPRAAASALADGLH